MSVDEKQSTEEAFAEKSAGAAAGSDENVQVGAQINQFCVGHESGVRKAPPIDRYEWDGIAGRRILAQLVGDLRGHLDRQLHGHDGDCIVAGKKA